MIGPGNQTSLILQEQGVTIWEGVVENSAFFIEEAQLIVRHRKDKEQNIKNKCPTEARDAQSNSTLKCR